MEKNKKSATKPTAPVNQKPIENTSVVTTEKPTAPVLAMPDPRTCLSVLIETDVKKRPTGWASKEAFDATIAAIKGETVNFVEEYKKWQRRSTDMALIVFYARQQYKQLNPIASDMDFIGDFFDASCKTMKQAEAMRSNQAYRAIVTYLFPIARKFVEAETARKLDLLAKQKQLATSQKLLAEVQAGTLSDETRKDALQRLPLTEAARTVLSAPNAKVDAALEAAVSETAQSVTTEVAKLSNPLSFDTKPQKDAPVGGAVAPKAGAKNDPLGKAIALAKVNLQKANVDAVTFNTVIDQLVKDIFMILEREPKAALAKANEYFLSMSDGQVHVAETMPPSAQIPPTEQHAPVTDVPTEKDEIIAQDVPDTDEKAEKVA